MKFAKWVFRLSGLWGILILMPLYFLENNIQFVPPPALTHPEYYYGFIGVGLAWQVVFLIIAMDPVKYRLLMIPSMLEKFSFCCARLFLFALGRVTSQTMMAEASDGTMGILFVISYFKTRSK